MDQYLLSHGKTYRALCDDGSKFDVEGGEYACRPCASEGYASTPWRYVEYPGGYQFLRCDSCYEEYPLVDANDIETCTRCGWQFVQGEVEYGDGPVLCTMCLCQPAMDAMFEENK